MEVKAATAATSPARAPLPIDVGDGQLRTVRDHRSARRGAELD
jgi:hypothetical protein